MRSKEFIPESWSPKYKKSINCSHPRGFSQKAHCAGKKKHNESIEMEATCPDCGMCQSHGNLNEIAKGAKDSNGVTKCWPGKHAEGTKKGKNGGQVRNCVPNESVAEGAPELLKAEMPLHRHAEKLLAQNGVSKDDPDYHKHLGNTINHLRKFGNIDLINNQGVAEAAKKGLYYNVNKRKAAGTSRPASSPTAPTAQAWRDAARTAKKD